MVRLSWLLLSFYVYSQKIQSMFFFIVWLQSNTPKYDDLQRDHITQEYKYIHKTRAAISLRAEKISLRGIFFAALIFTLYISLSASDLAGVYNHNVQLT